MLFNCRIVIYFFSFFLWNDDDRRRRMESFGDVRKTHMANDRTTIKYTLWQWERFDSYHLRLPRHTHTHNSICDGKLMNPKRGHDFHKSNTLPSTVCWLCAREKCPGDFVFERRWHAAHISIVCEKCLRIECVRLRFVFSTQVLIVYAVRLHAFISNFFPFTSLSLPLSFDFFLFIWRVRKHKIHQ